MAFKYNPLSGQIEDQEVGPQGPAGTVSSVGGGSVSEPAFRFQDDSDTGIYSGGANSHVLKIATGGTDRLTIDSSGRVGIGTNNPHTPLHIKVTGESSGTFGGGATQTGILRIQDFGTANNKYHGIEFRTKNSGDTRIMALDQGSNKSDLVFFLDHNNVFEHTRFTYDGKIGIGTTTPQDYINLEFNHSNNNDAISVADGLFINNKAADIGDYVSLSFSTDSGQRKKSAISHIETENYGGGDLVFSLDNGNDSGSLDVKAHERMRITSDGAVGIGTIPAATSSNTKRLALGAKASIWGRTSNNVNGALTLADNYYVNSAGTNKIIESGDAAYLNLRSGGLTFGTTDETYSAGATVGLSEKFRITNDGKVGIGTDTPNSQLVVKGPSNGQFEFQLDNENSVNKILSINRVANVYREFHYDGASHDLEIQGVSKFEIKSTGDSIFNGRLGVGVDASSSEGSELAIKSSDGATNVALIPNANTESSSLSFYNAAYDSQQGYIKYNNNNNSLQFRVNLGTALHINSSRQVGIGTDSPNAALTVHGSSGNAKIRLGQGGDHTIIGPDSTGHTVINAGTNGGITYFQSNGDTKLTIKNDGKVGIGTTNPEANLQVVGQGFFTAGDTDPGDNGRLVIEGNKGYADSATTLATSVTKSVLRIKGSNDSSDSLWMGTLTTGGFHHDPYIQGANSTGGTAKDIAIQPYNGNVSIGNDTPYSNNSFTSLTIGGKTKKGLIELKNESNAARAHIYEYSDDFNLSTVGSSGNIKFKTGGTPTDALTIDQNQRVGIGTTTPSRLVTIENDSSTTYDAGPGTGQSVYTNGAVLRLQNKNGSDNTGVNNQVGLEMFVGSGATSYGLLTFVRTGNYIGDLTYKSRLSPTGNYAEYFKIKSDGDVEIKQGDVSLADDKYLKFGDNDALTIREASGNNYINSGSGSLYIQAGGTSTLEVKDKNDGYNNKEVVIYSGAETPFVTLDSAAGASGQKYLECQYGGSNTSNGGIQRSGTTQTLTFYAGSDRRIKKDIVDMPTTLSKINQIQLKSFKYKNDPEAEGLGPIAQDLINIFPNKVSKSDSDDGTGDTVPVGVEPWTIGTDFTWELIKAVQELSSKIETLETKVAALESS